MSAELFGVLKLVHILSATLLFGTGLGTAFYQWRAHRSADLRTIAVATRSTAQADWWFTLPAVIIQPASGIAMLVVTGQDLGQPWILAALGLYAVTGACWIPVVWLQIQMRDLAQIARARDTAFPDRYHRYARTWFMLGWPAFLSVLAIFALMVLRPTSAAPTLTLHALLKLLHIVSSAVLLGTAFGTVFHVWRACRSGDARAIAFATSTIVLVDWLFILPAVVIQPLTGLWMLEITGQDWRQPWLASALVIYSLAGLCWFPLIPLQIRMRNVARAVAQRGMALPPQFQRYLRWWMPLNVAVFLSALAIFALMVLRPSFE
jgi:uncharacterized membrane protein